MLVFSFALNEDALLEFDTRSQESPRPAMDQIAFEHMNIEQQWCNN